MPTKIVDCFEVNVDQMKRIKNTYLKPHIRLVEAVDFVDSIIKQLTLEDDRRLFEEENADNEVPVSSV